MMEKRNIALCVVLSIVTCGIYAIYWFYKIDDDVYRLNDEPSRAGMDILLSIVTCGIYTIYLNYMWGKKLDMARQNRGFTPKDDSLLFMVLTLFGLSIVNYCIIQSSLNEDFDTPLQHRN